MFLATGLSRFDDITYNPSWRVPDLNSMLALASTCLASCLGGASWGFVSFGSDYTSVYTEYGGLGGIGFVKSYGYSRLVHPPACRTTDQNTAD